MEVILGSHTFKLNDENIAACEYFQGLKESKVCLTELAQEQKITTEEFEEFLRLLNHKPHALSSERLAFYADYFGCSLAANMLIADPQFSNLDWTLAFIRKNPSANALVPSVLKRIVPYLVSGEKELQDLPTRMRAGLVPYLLTVVRELKKQVLSPEKRAMKHSATLIRNGKLHQKREWNVLSLSEQAKFKEEYLQAIRSKVSKILDPPQPSELTSKGKRKRKHPSLE